MDKIYQQEKRDEVDLIVAFSHSQDVILTVDLFGSVLETSAQIKNRQGPGNIVLEYLGSTLAKIDKLIKYKIFIFSIF